MTLEDHLKPSENVQFKSDAKVKHGDSDYSVVVTNDRFILWAERGLIRSKDDILTWNLGNILRTEFKENGLLRKKGTFRLETEHDTVIELKSGANDMKTIYQSCMQFIE